jgi:hypothetical protein
MKKAMTILNQLKNTADLLEPHNKQQRPTSKYQNLI